MKMYHYVAKGHNVFEKGLLSFAKNPNADINYYIKRSGEKTHADIVKWMEKCFKGRSRGIRLFTCPLQWTDKSIRGIKGLIDACDLLEVDISALQKDGFIEGIYLKPSVCEPINPPDIGHWIDEYLVPLNSIQEIDYTYQQTWEKCDDSTGMRMAPLRFYLFVIKGGIILPKYIKKVDTK